MNAIYILGKFLQRLLISHAQKK